LEPYKDKEKNESNSPMIRENSSFEELVQMVQEKLKKFEEMTKVDMNARILEKFDNLREYYRKKQERHQMMINDLESKINLQLNKRIESLEKANYNANINYQNLFKKYSHLKNTQCNQSQVMKKSDSRNYCNTSLNLNARQLPRMLNLSVEHLETSPDLYERERKKKFDSMIGSKILVRKDKRPDENVSKLKLENFQLKSSLEGVTKKMESLIKENDELKTETNRNFYSLKLRSSELQGENHKLNELVSLQKSRGDLAKRNYTSMDKSIDMSLKTRNMSCEDSPRNVLDDSYRYAAYDNKESKQAKDMKMKQDMVKLQKRNDSLSKELKRAKEKTLSVARKINNFVDYARNIHDILEKYPQLKNLCTQLQDVAQNA